MLKTLAKWGVPLAGITQLAFAVNAAASELWDIRLPDGRPFVTVEHYGAGEKYEFGPGFAGVSDFTLNADERSMIEQGFDHLGRLIFRSVRAPATITLVTSGWYDDNATAWRPSYPEGVSAGMSLLGGQLLFGKDYSDEGFKSSALITIDHSAHPNGWYSAPMHTLPDNGYQSDLSSRLTHEMFHALGLDADLDYKIDEEGYVISGPENGIRHFEAVILEAPNLFTLGLRDSDGTAAEEGMRITANGGTQEASDETFDLTAEGAAASGVYFTGEHVQEVLNGAKILAPETTDLWLPGLPVNGWESGGYLEDGTIVYQPELSHIELQNSLMSHQIWRNWNTYMEAEIALLQDIGYTIDRRDWFGYSIYNTGVTVVNDHPFYERNADDTAYLTGVPNTNPWGIGLHIYGSNNHVTQAADILTAGTYGIGIRVDGSANTLVIAPETTVRADGHYGYGLAVTYGKNHHVIQRGLVAAQGAEGIGALFSSGSNELGEAYEQRGSYINEVVKEWNSGEEAELPETGHADYSAIQALGLDGALVTDFDVSGTLIGTKAAVMIDASALVSRINILKGASLSGDIVSEWDPTAERVQAPGTLTADKLITHLNFGLQAEADGSAKSASADASFVLSYGGDIRGGEDESAGVRTAAIAMRLAGGKLSYNGRADVLSVTVDEGATLSGNGTYNLGELSFDGQRQAGGQTPFGTFVMNGTLAPGNSIGTVTVNGAFVVGETGTLSMEFDASGNTDRLVLSKAPVDASGSTLSSLAATLAPAADYYGSTTLTVDLNGFVTVGENGAVAVDVPEDFSFSGPTLTMTGAADGSSDTLTVSTTRAADAYSRWAQSANARGVASAFDAMAGSAQGAMQDLVAALDFSIADDSELNGAFEALSPDSYARAGTAALEAQRFVSRAVIDRLSGALTETAGTSKSVYAVPLGGYADRDREGHRSTYAGVLAGVTTRSSSEAGELTIGGHTAYLNRTDKFTGTQGSEAKSDSFYLGAGVRYDFAGSGLYLFGLAQLSVENTDMDRSVLGQTLSSDWTGWGAGLTAGAGKTYRLSDAFSLGPVVWLDCSLAHLPDATEDQSRAGALHVESETYRSLRSSLGVKADWTPASETVRTTLSASLVWNHEFFSDYGTASASFAAWRGQGFEARADTEARDTASALVSVSVQTGESFVAAFGIGADGGDGISAVRGFADFKWRF